MIAARTSPAKQLERAEAEGWTYSGDMSTEGEVLQVLFALVRVEKPEICVETGTYMGHGTKAISDALEMNGRGHLWTIELDEAYEYASRDSVTYIQGDSVEWAANEAPDFIDLAFIDCGPPEIRVQAFANIFPKVKDDGLLLTHDVSFYEDAFLRELEESIGQQADMVFPALNGLAIWRKKGLVAT